MTLETLYPIVGTLLSAAIGALVAIVVSRRQIRNEFAKASLHVDATYRAKLYERRLSSYPEFSKHLSELSAVIRSERLPTALVRDTWKFVRGWDGANSIFMSPLSMQAMVALRKQLIALSECQDEFVSNNKSRGSLLPTIIEMQLALKTELGVMHLDGYHNPERAIGMHSGEVEDPRRYD